MMPMSASSQPACRIATLDEALPRRNRSLTAPLSIAVHLVVLGALVLVPVLSSSDLPEPATGVRAFLVEPPSVAAPPPPPPPAPAAAATRPAPQPSAAPSFVAPVETPDGIAPEADSDLGIEGGAPGGVEGGVEGGVVGGIIGGLPSAPAPTAPLRVGGQVKEPTKLKHVVPEYPNLALQARVKGTVVVEALIGPDGRVNDVTVLQGIPMLQEAAVKAVRQWVYTPTLLNGIPVPVIMTITLRFNFTA
jgi:protein TonB